MQVRNCGNCRFWRRGRGPAGDKVARLDYGSCELIDSFSGVRLPAYLDSADSSASRTALITSSDWGCVNHAATVEDDEQCYIVGDELLAQAEAHEQMLDVGRVARLEDALASAKAERDSLLELLATERQQHGFTKNKLANARRWSDQRIATLQETFDAFLALHKIEIDCEHGLKPVRCVICLGSWIRARSHGRRARESGT